MLAHGILGATTAFGFGAYRISTGVQGIFHVQKWCAAYIIHPMVASCGRELFSYNEQHQFKAQNYLKNETSAYT